MKLADLDPRWIRTSHPDDDGDDRAPLGISFRCPLHCEDGHGLAVYFENPSDGRPPALDSSAGFAPGTNWYPPMQPLWFRTGETFFTMSLRPSIDASKLGCWHGFIKNGEVFP